MTTSAISSGSLGDVSNATSTEKGTHDAATNSQLVDTSFGSVIPRSAPSGKTSPLAVTELVHEQEKYYAPPKGFQFIDIKTHQVATTSNAAVLGYGHTGVVFLARQGSSGPLITLKYPVWIAGGKNEKALKALRRDEKLLRKLAVLSSTENYVPHSLYVLKNEFGTRIFAKQFLKETIKDRLKRPCSNQIKRKMIKSLFTFVHTCHLQTPQVIISDLKSDNFGWHQQSLKFLDAGGCVFNAAGASTNLNPKQSYHTPSKGFKSPEQWAQLPLTAKTDIFLLAAIIHEILTGKLPEMNEDKSMRPVTLAPPFEALNGTLDKAFAQGFITVEAFWGNYESALKGRPDHAGYVNPSPKERNSFERQKEKPRRHEPESVNNLISTLHTLERSPLVKAVVAMLDDTLGKNSWSVNLMSIDSNEERSSKARLYLHSDGLFAAREGDPKCTMTLWDTIVGKLQTLLPMSTARYRNFRALTARSSVANLQYFKFDQERFKRRLTRVFIAIQNGNAHTFLDA